jgi:hypothetical protein
VHNGVQIVDNGPGITNLFLMPISDTEDETSSGEENQDSGDDYDPVDDKEELQDT